MEWIEVGQIVGTAAAAFMASVATMQSRVAAVRQGVEREGERTDVLMNRLDGMQRSIDALTGKVQALEDRAVKFVTDEEFHAYVRTTTEAVNGLSEKVGRAAGAIEAWYSSQRK